MSISVMWHELWCTVRDMRLCKCSIIIILLMLRSVLGTGTLCLFPPKDAFVSALSNTVCSFVDIVCDKVISIENLFNDLLMSFQRLVCIIYAVQLCCAHVFYQLPGAFFLVFFTFIVTLWKNY